MRGRFVRLLAVLVFFSAAAQAQTGPRLVLVAGSDQDLSRRLLAEGKQAGFDIVVHEGDAQPSSSELARQSHAVGVLRIAGPAKVELWLVGDEQQAPSGASFRQQNGEADGFAVRVIEETRSRVVALHLPELAAPDAPAAPARGGLARADTPAPKAPALDVFDAGAGVALTKATGLGPTLHAELHARTRLASRIGAGAFAFVPLASNEFSGAEGTGRAEVFVFGAGLHWLAWQPTSALKTELGAAGGAVWLPLHADPSAGYSAHPDQLVAALALASAALDLRLASWLGLRTSVLVGSSLPRPVVRFDGHELASFGHFFAGGSTALEIIVPE